MRLRQPLQILVLVATPLLHSCTKDREGLTKSISFSLNSTRSVKAISDCTYLKTVALEGGLRIARTDTDDGGVHVTARGEPDQPLFDVEFLPMASAGSHAVVHAIAKVEGGINVSQDLPEILRRCS